MRIDNSAARKLETGGIMESQKATLAGDAHIFEMLAKQYQRPEEAVIRETLCNAHDAQVEQGTVDIPVDLQLPNYLKPELRIRDYGTGLSKEHALKLFTCYGFSTKRETQSAIGFFGIGSKAFFAVTDSAVITSYHEGIRYVFTFYKGEDGTPIMSLLHESETNQPSGLEISYPVPKGKIDRYVNAAKTVLPRMLLRQQVKVTGVKDFQPKPIEYSVNADRWAVRCENTYNPIPRAIMGGVSYPIDRNALYGDAVDARVYHLLSCPLDLHFEIGDLKPVPSREGLEYTDKTRSQVINLLKIVKEELPKKYESEFTNCKTLWEAKCLLRSVIEKSSLETQVKNALVEEIKWNGQPIGGCWVELNSSGVKFSIFGHGELNSDRPKYRWIHDLRIKASSELKFIWDDLPRGAMGRFKQKYPDAAGAVFFKSADDSVIAKLGNPPYEKASDLPEVPRATPMSRSTPQVRKIYLFTNSSHYSLTEVDYNVAAGGVYVDMYNSRVTLEKGHTGFPSDDDSRFKRVFKALIEMKKINADQEIFGFPASLRRLPVKTPGWVHFSDFVISCFTEKDKEDLIARWQKMKIRQTIYASDFDGAFRILTAMVSNKTKPKTPARPFGKTFELLKTVVDIDKVSLDMQDLEALLKFLNLQPKELDTARELKTLLEETEKEYPLIKLFSDNRYSFNGPNPERRTSLIDYVNLIDASKL